MAACALVPQQQGMMGPPITSLCLLCHSPVVPCTRHTAWIWVMVAGCRGIAQHPCVVVLGRPAACRRLATTVPLWRALTLQVELLPWPAVPIPGLPGVPASTAQPRVALQQAADTTPCPGWLTINR